jgi:hypothetical protein
VVSNKFLSAYRTIQKKETLKKFRVVKIDIYYRAGTCTDREFHIISLNSTGALNMGCMNYRLPSVWYSIPFQTFASMSLVTDICILLVLRHSSGMFAGNDDINTTFFTHHNKRKSHSIMSSDLGCHEHCMSSSAAPCSITVAVCY